jgi:hypothetical protein
MMIHLFDATTLYFTRVRGPSLVLRIDYLGLGFEVWEEEEKSIKRSFT